MATTISEIAPDVFSICTYVEQAGLQFRQFLIRDEQPLLYHTGTRRMFERVRDAVGQIMDPSSLRWIAFSHFEADECGALNYWLQEARGAQAACSANGALVSVDDYAFSKVRPLSDGETLSIGSHRLRFLATPHLPQGWDAGHLYDETTGVLFCSDLLHQAGDVPATTTESRVAAMRATLEGSRDTPMDWYVPWTPQTRARLERLAALQPKVCATMHGSAYIGDGAAELRALADMLEEVYGGGQSAP
jgi:flavorubredoxin